MRKWRVTGDLHPYGGRPRWIVWDASGHVVGIFKDWRMAMHRANRGAAGIW